MPEKLTLSEFARLGGKSKSKKKIKSALKNLEKAREVLAKKRKKKKKT